MKYVVFLGDGMSDRPVHELGGRTPLQVARTDNLDRMVRQGVGGWSLNTPEGFYPGSDVANLGVLGYDVRQGGYTGRSPLEAAAMGVDLTPDEVAFRCNLVTLRDDFTVMDDFSAGHIGSQEAARIIETVNAHLGSEVFRFHPGVGYRHLLVWKGGSEDLECTAPHDISDQPVAGRLPRGADAGPILDLMQRSWSFLSQHPVNGERLARGDKAANSIWLWGLGRRPELTPFAALHGKSGGMISAVDLMRGIAAHIGFEFVAVPGATGWVDTNYAGKAAACIEGLSRHDLMFVHVESPDEAGHAGRLDLKIKAIEDFDAQVVGPVLSHLENSAFPYRAVSLPDHPTPIATRTHNADRVPFAMCGHGIAPDTNTRYDEGLLETASLTFDPGCSMMKWFLRG